MVDIWGRGRGVSIDKQEITFDARWSGIWVSNSDGQIAVSIWTQITIRTILMIRFEAKILDLKQLHLKMWLVDLKNCRMLRITVLFAYFVWRKSHHSHELCIRLLQCWFTVLSIVNVPSCWILHKLQWAEDSSAGRLVNIYSNGECFKQETCRWVSSQITCRSNSTVQG